MPTIPKRMKHPLEGQLLKPFLSSFHLNCALKMRDNAKRLEAGGLNDLDQTEEHAASVISAIWFSVAFLDGSINELFETASDSATSFLYFENNDLDEKKFSLLWKEGNVSRFGAIEKHELALRLGNRQPFAKGETLAAVRTLVAFRNSLTHYSPKWVPADEAQGVHNLSDSLRGKFRLHPKAKNIGVVFPKKYLSADCARWAIKTALDFSDAFFTLLGLRHVSSGSLSLIREGIATDTQRKAKTK